MSFLLLLSTILCYIIHHQSMTKVIAQESKFTHLSSITNICSIVLLFIYHHVIQIVVQDQWLQLVLTMISFTFQFHLMGILKKKLNLYMGEG